MKLTKEIIEENRLDIMASMVQYFFSSLSLMYRLCEKLNIPEDRVSEDIRNRIPGDAVSGELDDEWDYWFHGYQCKFCNMQSGQVVDVQLKQYGHLPAMMDPGFFLKYLQTTPGYRSIAVLFGNDYENACFAVHTLLKDHSGTLDISLTYTEIVQAKKDEDYVPLTQERINTFLFGKNYNDRNDQNLHGEILTNGEIDAILKKIRSENPVMENKSGKVYSQEEITEILDKIVKNHHVNNDDSSS